MEPKCSVCDHYLSRCLCGRKHVAQECPVCGEVDCESLMRNRGKTTNEPEPAIRFWSEDKTFGRVFSFQLYKIAPTESEAFEASQAIAAMLHHKFLSAAKGQPSENVVIMAGR